EEWDLVPIRYGGPVPKQAIAGLAPVVLREAEKGDRVAQEVVEQAVSDVADLVAALRRRAGLPDPSPLVVVGGLFSNSMFFERFREEINRRSAERRVGIWCGIQTAYDELCGNCEI